MTEAWPVVRDIDLPWVTTNQIREVDRIMIEDLRIELIQMMENAGRALANVVLAEHSPETAVVLCGTGGNGGGGLVAARRLANAGVFVTVMLTASQSGYFGVPLHQLDIADRMGLSILNPDDEGWGELKDDVIVDALIGYSLSGAPRGPSAALIGAVSQSSIPVISLDVPSGIDATTGETRGHAISADITVTLAAPKTALRDSVDVGRLLVADISVPPSVYQSVGFRHEPIPFGHIGVIEVAPIGV